MSSSNCIAIISTTILAYWRICGMFCNLLLCKWTINVYSQDCSTRSSQSCHVTFWGPNRSENLAVGKLRQQLLLPKCQISEPVGSSMGWITLYWHAEVTHNSIQVHGDRLETVQGPNLQCGVDVGSAGLSRSSTGPDLAYKLASTTHWLAEFMVYAFKVLLF